MPTSFLEIQLGADKSAILQNHQEWFETNEKMQHQLLFRETLLLGEQQLLHGELLFKDDMVSVLEASTRNGHRDASRLIEHVRAQMGFAESVPKLYEKLSLKLQLRNLALATWKLTSFEVAVYAGHDPADLSLIVKWKHHGC